MNDKVFRGVVVLVEVFTVLESPSMTVAEARDSQALASRDSVSVCGLTRNMLLGVYDVAMIARARGSGRGHVRRLTIRRLRRARFLRPRWGSMSAHPQSPQRPPTVHRKYVLTCNF